MKKIKIYGLPSHQSKDRTSGVDFIRIIQPLRHLQDNKDFKVKLFDIDSNEEWKQIAKAHDIIYFSYLNSPWGFAAMGSMARKYGRKLVMDLDDNLWKIKSDNPAYDVFKKDSEGIKTITAIAREVDYITCTSNYLRNAIFDATQCDYNKIKVFPNYIDLDLYTHRTRPKKDREVNIGHFGSTTHFSNLVTPEFLKAMDKIMQDYPNVTFTTIGSFFSEFKMRWGQRYVQDFGDSDIYKWVKNKFPSFMDKIDFFVTPLEEDVYNQCKSATKFNEVSSAKRAGVWQNIRQYREVVEDGKTGYLCTHTHEWYESMKRLIEDAELRNKMGEDAFKKVEEKYTIQGNIGKYADFFREIAQ